MHTLFLWRVPCIVGPSRSAKPWSLLAGITSGGHHKNEWSRQQQPRETDFRVLWDVSMGHTSAYPGLPIRIPRPTDPTGWFCRHRYSAMHLQVVCNENLEIIHADAGHAGSLHDARVYRMSGLDDLLRDPQTGPPDHMHILGDAALPIKEWTITPFRQDGHLTHDKIMFNYKHSSVRTTVERCFGLLKGKWGRFFSVHVWPWDHMSYLHAVYCTTLFLLMKALNRMMLKWLLKIDQLQQMKMKLRMSGETWPASPNGSFDVTSGIRFGSLFRLI